ncbi:MAG: hypothetical protein FJX67_03190 [Alphaproteobacteria bacterium]|nr:hypothetical protein [Alphaproteobacteria bacterium]
MQYDYISADNHLDLLWMPSRLWQERLPKALRETGPKVVETAEGTYWTWEGRRRGASADGRDNEKHIRRFRKAGAPVADGALPPSDPRYLREHMDLSKIYASVIFGDVRKWNIADRSLLLAVYQAYNDWAVETSATDPDRILILPQLPVAIPEACTPEIERLARKGARGFEFCPFDVASPVNDPLWDPTWRAAAAAATPLCMHIGGAADSALPPARYGARHAFLSTAPFNIANTCAQLVYGAVFERHPTLKVLFGECRIGWVPFFIQWMDRQVVEREPDPTAPLTLMPSEYIRRQVTFAFEEDYIGAKLMAYDWSWLKDVAVWGSDYPHDQGTWPDVSPMVRMFDGIDPATRRAVLFDRAAALFRITGPVAA